MTKRISGEQFSKMIEAGASQLAEHTDEVNALNVFPVPDGDTGTNMTLSLQSGVQEMKQVGDTSLSNVVRGLSKGLLMGARGNSGVILSQLFRGFATPLHGKTEIDIALFIAALQEGVKTAYKAVMKPVEGTILTVAKDVADRCYRERRNIHSFETLLQRMVEEAEKSVNRTPFLLPVLQEVGVVDSGGKGLLYVYTGFLYAIKNNFQHVHREQSEVPQSNALSNPSEINPSVADKRTHVQTEVQEMMQEGILSVDDITYGYCTEFIIRRNLQENGQTDSNAFRAWLDTYGDSILVIDDDELIKVHIHTEKVGEVLHKSQAYGELMNIKIENMREQFRTLEAEASSLAQKTSGKIAEKEQNNTSKDGTKPFAVIAVSMGDGIARIFKSLGVDTIIHGGQTMNPSTEDFIRVIESVAAEHYILLPNNSNVIMTAQQTVDILDERSITVIPSQNVAQGMAALLQFNPLQSRETNEQSMNDALQTIRTGEVTQATRNTEFKHIHVREGEYIALMDKTIVASSHSLNGVSLRLLDAMAQDDDEILTIIYGEDLSEGMVQYFVGQVKAEYPELEIELHQGGQPLYPYFFSLE